jgi:hypothetical protein
LSRLFAYNFPLPSHTVPMNGQPDLQIANQDSRPQQPPARNSFGWRILRNNSFVFIGIEPEIREQVAANKPLNPKRGRGVDDRKACTVSRTTPPTLTLAPTPPPTPGCTALPSRIQNCDHNSRSSHIGLRFTNREPRQRRSNLPFFEKSTVQLWSGFFRDKSSTCRKKSHRRAVSVFLCD